MKNLNTYGVQEISLEESFEINGGVNPWLVGAFFYLLAEWDDIEDGYKDGRG